MVSLKQLNYALAVEKMLHFKKAAEYCNVSQSALSTALLELEKQLGFQIFERDNKKVLVTPLGKEVLEKARHILLSVEDLQHLAEASLTPLSAPIKLGIIPTIAPFLLPVVLPAIQEHFPNAQLEIIEDQSHVLVDLVRRGEIDSAILALPYPCEGLLGLEFWQEDFYWVAPKGEKYSELNEISNKELKESHLMLLKDGHCLKDHVLDACQLEQDSAQHEFGAASLSTLIQLVKGKLGSTLIPEMALEQLVSKQNDLAAVHLNEKGPHRRIAFIIRPNYTRMSSIEALKKLCVEALSE